MALISVQSVKKFYGRQDVLRGASFQINSGERVGLIGANGAGKTTLLRMILGRERPDEGEVTRLKGLRLGYLPQDLMTFSGQTLLDMVMDTAEEIRALEAELAYIAADIEEAAKSASPDEEALLELTERQGRLLAQYEDLDGYTLQAQAEKILEGLGFTKQDFDRPIDEFSGGWMMRAVLARLLLAGPDVLLLDEPTNHLDMDSLLWLENYLLSCSSALILVSHDRVFLNNVIKRVVEVDRGMTYSYTGNYDSYQVDKEKRVAMEAAAYAGQQERIKQAERFIERSRVRAATARQVQSRIKMLGKMDKIEAPVTSARKIRFSLPPAPRSPEILCELEGVTKRYGSLTVYQDLDFSVRRGDRIAFLGANGRGKSTLLKMVAGTTDFQEGRRRMGEGVVASYFAQFQLEELNPNNTVLEELSLAAGDLTAGSLRNILGSFLFKGDDVFKKTAVLSGGEKTRVILAKMMVTAPNLLLLDEPSNHLDIPGRDMLEQALRQYTGSICLISHDRRLINAVANKVLVIKDRRVEVLPGSFDDFQNIWENRLAEEAASGSSPEEVREDPGARTGLTRAEKEARKRAEAEARQKLYRERAPLQREIEILEARQAEITSRMDEISADLARPETYRDVELSKTLNQDYGRLKSEIEKVTSAWEEAALRLEEIESGLDSESD